MTDQEERMTNERRYKSIWIEIELITLFLKGECKPNKWTNAPKDMIAVDVVAYPLKREVLCTVYSKTFPILGEGESIPSWDLWLSNENKCPVFDGARAVTDD